MKTTETKEIVTFNAPELQGVEKSKAEQIKSTFLPMAEMLTDFEEAFNEIVLESKSEITKEVTSKAKRLRIDIGKVRIETEKTRKEQKDEYLRAGKAIDGVSNILKWAISEKENKLKEIENHFEILEQKRLEELQLERAEQLSEYVEDAHDRRLSEMDEDVWNAYYNSKKQEHIDRLAAELQAEKDRIAKEKEEAKKLKEQRLENIRLKKEAEAKAQEEAEKKIILEKRTKELQPYIVFIRDYNGLISKSEKDYKKEFSDIKKGAEDHWEFERKEQLRKQKEEEQAEIARKKALYEQEVILKKEREEKAKLEAELKAKQLAEAEEIERKNDEILKAKEEAEKLAKAPIKKQLSIWVDGFSIELPNSELLNNEKALLIKSKFESFKTWAKSEIEKI